VVWGAAVVVVVVVVAVVVRHGSCVVVSELKPLKMKIKLDE
jgi:hypothetical protein